MFAPSMREASPLTSPRAGMAHSWASHEAALEREAEVIVRTTDAQLASLREAALSLSLERRRDRCAPRGADTPVRTRPRLGARVLPRRRTPARAAEATPARTAAAQSRGRAPRSTAGRRARAAYTRPLC